jgi:hypothetical protein
VAAARALFETVFESAPIGMLVGRGYSDGTVDVIECNAAFARMLGREPSGCRPHRHVDHPPGRQTTSKRMLDDVLAGRPSRASCASSIATATTSAPDRAEPDARPASERLIVLQAVGISSASSSRPVAAPRRSRFADGPLQPPPLPGRARARGQPRARVAARSAILLDLDGSVVNDSFGHAAGDELLTRIGNALATSCATATSRASAATNSPSSCRTPISPQRAWSPTSSSTQCANTARSPATIAAQQ